jgi:hypothetical protein
MRLFLLSLLFISSVCADAQILNVQIIGRQDSDTDYSYVVPGHYTSQSYSNGSLSAHCSSSDLGATTSTNCDGSTNGATTTTGTVSPAQAVSFHVHGATLTLQLPDKRAVVVNCRSKFQERFAGARGNHRDCRVPLVDDVQANFHGDNAKLEWNVSLDGKKTQSETYKIIAILDKVNETPNIPNSQAR